MLCSIGLLRSIGWLVFVFFFNWEILDHYFFSHFFLPYSLSPHFGNYNYMYVRLIILSHMSQRLSSFSSPVFFSLVFFILNDFYLSVFKLNDPSIIFNLLFVHLVNFYLKYCKFWNLFWVLYWFCYFLEISHLLIIAIFSFKSAG